MWKPTQKQITPKEHGIAWVEYIIDPINKLKIGMGIPIDNIIVSLFFY
jgi:hypothetical protein